MKKLIIILLLSLMSSIGVTYYLGFDFYTSQVEFLFIFVYISVCICFLSTKSYNYLIKNRNTLSTKKILILLVISSSFYLIFGFLLSINKWGPPQQSSLEIIATGEKNFNALNSEVWIRNILVDTSPVDIKSIQYDKTKWELRDSTLISYPQYSSQPSSLYIKYIGKKITLNLSNHPYSGKIEVVNNGVKESIDLYSSSPNQYIDLTFTPIYKFPLLALLYFSCFWVVLTLSLISLIIRMLNYQIKVSEDNDKYFRNTFFLILFVNFIYLLILYPGNMTPDSVDQWNQKETFLFNNHHPIFSTLYIWALTLVWDSPVAVVVFQIFFFALINAYLLKNIKEFNVLSPMILNFTRFFITFFPLHGFMLNTLWKDIPYAFCFLILTTSLILLVLSNGNWIYNNFNKFILCSSLLGITLIKHDGIYIAVITSLILLLLYRKHYKCLLKVLIPFIIIVILLKSLVVSNLSKHDTPSWMAFTLPIHQVKLILDNKNSNVDSHDLAFFRSIIPEEGKEKRNNDHYTPYVPFFGVLGSFNSELFSQNKDEFLNRWLKLVILNKDYALEIWKKQTSIIWSVKRPQDGYQYVVDTGFVLENNYGIYSNSVIPHLKYPLANQWKFILGNDNLSWFFGRPALYVYICILCSVVFSLRNGWRAAIVLLPLLLSVGGLSLTIQAQDTRYLYSVFLIAPYIFLYSFIPRDNTIN